jgi:hypothetical protein
MDVLPIELQFVVVGVADKARLHVGFGDDGNHLLVEFFDNLRGCALRCADAKPTAGLVARHKFIDGGDVRQHLQARSTGYGEGS